MRLTSLSRRFTVDFRGNFYGGILGKVAKPSTLFLEFPLLLYILLTSHKAKPFVRIILMKAWRIIISYRSFLIVIAHR